MNTFFQNFKQWCLKVSVSSIIFISVIILGGTIITAALPSSLNNLTSQASPPHQLTAEKWNNLLTYVGDLTDTITTLSGTISTLSSTLSILSDENQTLSGELANLKNQEFSGFEQVPLGTIIATNGSTSKTAMNADGWALCDGSSIASQVS
ncbi:MAG: hypothetical protein LBG59_00820 [Candidatus Peribacteria bacterium]|jgi:predicted PurR-regulated permease PerM|nr:hypothetical protein [Candidatus Peribacteria bacterium]